MNKEDRILFLKEEISDIITSEN